MGTRKNAKIGHDSGHVGQSSTTPGKSRKTNTRGQTGHVPDPLDWDPLPVTDWDIPEFPMVDFPVVDWGPLPTIEWDPLPMDGWGPFPSVEWEPIEDIWQDIPPVDWEPLDPGIWDD